jgi:hypothetical protein
MIILMWVSVDLDNTKNQILYVLSKTDFSEGLKYTKKNHSQIHLDLCKK